jgi:hypothetical protein
VNRSLQQDCRGIDLPELKAKSASHSRADVQKTLVNYRVAGDADLTRTLCACLAFESID